MAAALAGTDGLERAGELLGLALPEPGAGRAAAVNRERAADAAPPTPGGVPGADRRPQRRGGLTAPACGKAPAPRPPAAGPGRVAPMLASLRAELLILRKSKAAWALVPVAPLLTLVTVYVFQFLDYLGDTPAAYAQMATPAMNLPALLPSQFIIQAVEPAFLHRAVHRARRGHGRGDWGRGTIKAALLAGPGRARTFAGQAAAILIACALSVVLSFVLAALASVAIRGYVGPAAPGLTGNGTFPAGSVMGEGVGAGLLIGMTYGALGIALGTACRSAAGGVAAALVWYFLADNELYQLSLDAGGCFSTSTMPSRRPAWSR